MTSADSAAAADDQVDSEDVEFAPTPAPELTPDQIEDILINGELEVIGRLTDASNVTVLGRSTLADVTLDCVYKPIRGERPLWDFPDGSLAAREVGSAIIARAAGWNCVPPTFFRGGPIGSGMVQQWIDGTDQDDTVNLFKPKDLPAGWLPVLRAADNKGRPLILAHADTPELALLACFDLVVNNADRKAPHILPVRGGPVLGVDHGLTLHHENKVRTVLWGWAGTPLPDAGLAGLERLASMLDGPLGEELSELITVTELVALIGRVDELLRRRTFAVPPDDRTPIPWPPL